LSNVNVLWRRRSKLAEAVSSMGKEVRPDPKEEVIARGEDILKNSRVEASNLGPLAK
jgi:hypothetical protein